MIHVLISLSHLKTKVGGGFLFQVHLSQPFPDLFSSERSLGSNLFRARNLIMEFIFKSIQSSVPSK